MKGFSMNQETTSFDHDQVTLGVIKLQDALAGTLIGPAAQAGEELLALFGASDIMDEDNFHLVLTNLASLDTPDITRLAGLSHDDLAKALLSTERVAGS